MVNCSVPCCKNTSAKMTKDKDGITFHRFPRDTERRRRWEMAVTGEDDWSTSMKVVCSDHFHSKHFYLTDNGLRRLLTNAVPSVNLPDNDSSENSDQDIQETEPEDSEEVKKLKNKIKRLEILAAYRKRRLILLWKGKLKLKTKLDTMKTIVRHLMKLRRRSLNKSK